MTAILAAMMAMMTMMAAMMTMMAARLQMAMMMPCLVPSASRRRHISCVLVRAQLWHAALNLISAACCIAYLSSSISLFAVLVKSNQTQASRPQDRTSMCALRICWLEPVSMC